VATEWGQHSLVDAARALLRAARRNPRAAKFVLLSESDLPLYGPQLVYAQLIGERLSRINACNTTAGWRLFDHRWVDRMASDVLQAHHWRKSWQVSVGGARGGASRLLTIPMARCWQPQRPAQPLAGLSSRRPRQPALPLTRKHTAIMGICSTQRTQCSHAVHCAPHNPLARSGLR
jgi:hypothetical protein